MPAKSRQHATARSAPAKPATPQTPVAKTRAVKRRGRARAGSDDEITREALSDGSDDAESDSDSDSEHPAMQAPPTPVSPHRRPKPAPAAASWGDESVANDWSQPAATDDWSAEKPAVNDWSADEPKPASDAWGTAWASEGNDWSVEHAKDKDNVPVVDFADFNAGRMPLSPPSNATTPPQEPRDDNRTLRQAYMERLNSDPSFVPFVGSFYGHDDRFMDVQFRKMNRWAQRGANFRGRGGFRGGFAARAPPRVEDEELPPAERSTWKHDGYEELSRSEERRQFSPRGRGGARGRGRGGLRGGFVQHTPPALSPLAGDNSTAASQPEQPPKPAKLPKASKPPPHWKADRGTWFIEKPERTWTKQTDTYLFNEAQPRPRATITENPVRIKLPGEGEASVVKVPALPRGKGLSASAAVSTPAPVDAPIVIKLRPTTSAVATLPVSEPEAVPVEREEPASRPDLRPDVAPYEPPAHRQIFGPLPGVSEMNGDWSHRALPPHQDPAFQASAPQPQFAPEMQPQYMPTPPPAIEPQAYVPPPVSASPMYHSPAGYGYSQPLPSGYDMHGRPVFYPPPGHGHHHSMSMTMPPPPPMVYGQAPSQPVHARHESVQFVPPHGAEYYAQPGHAGPPPMAQSPARFEHVVDPETGRPFFKPARSAARIQIRAPGSSPAADAATQPAEAPPREAPAPAPAAGAPLTIAPEFVPRHGHHPSMSMSMSMPAQHNPYAAPMQQQHGGTQYFYPPPPMDGYGYGAAQPQMGYGQPQAPYGGEYYMMQPPPQDAPVYY